MVQIVIIDGHPDPAGGHLCDALAEAYARGAKQAGHTVSHLRLAAMEIEVLRSQNDQEHGQPGSDILRAQQEIRAASHLVLIFPLWLGDMPALTKAFLEQVARPGFAYAPGKGPFAAKLLAGRSARVVITMGMPAFWYRFVYRAASLTALKIGILRFVGFAPVRATLIGSVAAPDFDGDRWLARLERLGRAAR
ncbi:NAD(P)H-dependent oxidoreductase [Rhizobium sp. CSW-27]|uniref:NAD(P)H-dependent oxidoreductase n=1 Tax=Rhizobium sp. CSW-27 TaxID=2839985 RepID=UPI001C02B4AE|nr:NAD(P)H-dependent oxidoreductase [Rhizobium sp. CSW-27]MBT9373110.1 NAD(P)H-dependent oxidoreductase [Rhizobium sp. CSW-27]